MKRGYSRCSTNETKQDIGRQVRELKAAGAEVVYMEYEHGDAKVKSQQAQMRLLAGEAWNNSWNLVFTNELGGHLCHCTVYKKFKAIVSEIGMPEERFHDLRHSFAVASIESGDDIKTVQSNLGHATASFTLDVYGHVSQKMRQQSADRMEEFIQKVSG